MQISEEGLRALIRYILDRLGEKLDKSPGMGLSEKNFTEAYQAILEGVYSGNGKGLVPEGRDALPDAFLRQDGTWQLTPDTQSDWENTDPGSAAFIQNKPFGVEIIGIVDEQTIKITGQYAELVADPGAFPESGEIQCELNGEQYTLQVESEYEDGRLVRSWAGNLYLVTGQYRDQTEERFCILSDTEHVYLYAARGDVTISATETIVRALSPEMVNLSDLFPITDAEIDMLFAEAADMERSGDGESEL